MNMNIYKIKYGKTKECYIVCLDISSIEYEFKKWYGNTTYDNVNIKSVELIAEAKDVQVQELKLT